MFFYTIREDSFPANAILQSSRKVKWKNTIVIQCHKECLLFSKLFSNIHVSFVAICAQYSHRFICISHIVFFSSLIIWLIFLGRSLTQANVIITMLNAHFTRIIWRVDCVKVIAHQFTRAVSNLVPLSEIWCKRKENKREKKVAFEGDKMHTCISSKQTDCHCHLTMKIYWVIASSSSSVPRRDKWSGISKCAIFLRCDKRELCLSKKEKFSQVPRLLTPTAEHTARTQSIFNWNKLYTQKTIIIVIMIITMPRIYSENNERINKFSKEIFFVRLHYSSRSHTANG